MHYLLDTGILLRVINRDDVEHVLIRAAVKRLKTDGHATVSAPQNLAEFWNVCTRPHAARGGLGLTVEETARRLTVVERIAPVVPDSPAAYGRWKALVENYRVMGVQVHDARLVALMTVVGISHILSVNDDHFRRYTEITVLHPRELVSANSNQ